MWAMLFCIHLNGKWWVCYDRGGYKIAGGPYDVLQGEDSAFAGMATLRGQTRNGVLLR